MQAIEFEATPDSDGKIAIPEAFKDALSGKKIKIIVLFKEDDEPQSPPTEHYTKGYNQKDSLYDAY